MSLSNGVSAAYIETGLGRIFTLYNEPQGEIVRSSAIVLLYPGDQEYKMVHWAYRNLASSLAKNGWPVLRMDYLGTGDSAGETGTGNLDLWTQNAFDACSYLKTKVDALHLQVVAVRLGTFVASQLTTRIDILNTILWDPPLDGKSYLRELRNLEQQLKRYDRFKKVEVPAAEFAVMEYSAGFPVSQSMITELDHFCWNDAVIKSEFMHIVLSKTALNRSWISGKKGVKHLIDEDPGWALHKKIGDALLAPSTISGIVDIIGRPHHE